MLLSRSTWMPCGETISPAPKLFTTLPLRSNLTIGSTAGLSRHALLPPQRSATQIDRPSRSTSTALSDPHMRPSGSVHFATDAYGFGASFVGVGVDWAARAKGR